MPTTDRSTDRPLASLFRSGLAARLILATSLSSVVWAGVAWALAP